MSGNRSSGERTLVEWKWHFFYPRHFFFMNKLLSFISKNFTDHTFSVSSQMTFSKKGDGGIPHPHSYLINTLYISSYVMYCSITNLISIKLVKLDMSSLISKMILPSMEVGACEESKPSTSKDQSLLIIR